MSDKKMRKIQYYHVRIEDLKSPNNKFKAKGGTTIYYLPNKFSAKGGATICYLPNENKANIGVAICSKEDSYNKKTGRTLAYQNALRDSTISQGPLETYEKAYLKGMLMVEGICIGKREYENRKIHQKMSALKTQEDNNISYYKDLVNKNLNIKSGKD